MGSSPIGGGGNFFKNLINGGFIKIGQNGQAQVSGLDQYSQAARQLDGNGNDILDINFNRIADIEQQQPQSDVAKLINQISLMSPEQAKAQFKNPDVVNKLVSAGIFEDDQ